MPPGTGRFVCSSTGRVNRAVLAITASAPDAHEEAGGNGGADDADDGRCRFEGSRPAYLSLVRGPAGSAWRQGSLRTGVPASCAAGRAAATRTICAAGGINASLETPDPEDRVEIHAADTIREGHFVCDPRAVELPTRRASDRIPKPAQWACGFDTPGTKRSINV